MKNLTDQLLFALVARIPIFAFILSASVVNALLCCSNVAIAQTPQISADRSQPSQRETSKSERGITGSTTFYYDGPALQAKVQREAAAPLVLRIQRGTSPASTRRATLAMFLVDTICEIGWSTRWIANRGNRTAHG